MDLTTKTTENEAEKVEDVCNIAENLQALIKARNVNLNDLSKAVGVSKTSIYNILDRTSIPRLDTAISIAKFFNISLDQLSGLSPLNIRKKLTIDVPIFEWNSLFSFLTEGVYPTNVSNYIVEPDSQIIFGFKIDITYEPFIPNGSICLVSKGEIKSGCFGLILTEEMLSIRFLIIESNQIHAKSLIDNSKITIERSNIVGYISHIIQKF